MARIKLALVAAGALALVCSSAAARGGHGYGGGHSRSYSSRIYSSHSYSSYSYNRSYAGDHYVHGYTRRNGTYVSGYHATNPNRTRNDNYSTRGNVNPYTGEAGTKPRDGE